MFEKEAEERITEQYGTSGEYITRQRIWQDGAEYGFNKAMEWHYPSENDFPPFDVRVYVWSDKKLWRGCYTQHESKVDVGDGKKEMRTFKWWEVYGKGGIYSMQNTVDAWMPMSAIKPPKEIK